MLAFSSIFYSQLKEKKKKKKQNKNVDFPCNSSVCTQSCSSGTFNSEAVEVHYLSNIINKYFIVNI
jgi:hypothetical protein